MFRRAYWPNLLTYSVLLSNIGDHDSESIVIALIIQAVFQVSVEHTGGGGGAKISFT